MTELMQHPWASLTTTMAHFHSPSSPESDTLVSKQEEALGTGNYVRPLLQAQRCELSRPYPVQQMQKAFVFCFPTSPPFLVLHNKHKAHSVATAWSRSTCCPRFQRPQSGRLDSAQSDIALHGPQLSSRLYSIKYKNK